MNPKFINFILTFFGQIYFIHGNFDKTGAVASNAVGCDVLGRAIILTGGSAADAAITVTLCEGVMLPQSSGIGGGFLATIYDKKRRQVISLNAREWAPSRSSENMFVNKTVSGGIAVAVPGEILGLYKLHTMFGRLKWKTLVEPIIPLCKKGHRVTKYLAYELEQMKDLIKTEESLRDFINPKTGDVWKLNDIMKRPKLAKTFEKIAKNGAFEFYEGETAKNLVKDIQKRGGIITLEDFKKYRVHWSHPTNISFLEKYNVYSAPLPGSGPVLSMILNIMELASKSEMKTDQLYHTLIESFKHAYGHRTNLGDSQFNNCVQKVADEMLSKEYAKKLFNLINPDKTFNDFGYYGAEYSDVKSFGTNNLAVLHPEGDAVVITSTINTVFGAKFASPSTGIILNDQMDDFSTPGKDNAYGFKPSPSNYIKPFKRPVSSMSPSIILDQSGKVRLLIGAAGGSQITTSVALTSIRHLFLKQTLQKAIGDKRLHHQLAPNEVQYEEGFDKIILKSLEEKGHKLQKVQSHGFNAVTAIGVDNRNIVNPVIDPRRGGSTSVIRFRRVPL